MPTPHELYDQAVDLRDKADKPAAIAKLEEARVSTILGKLERGEPVPVPRPPLREEIGGLDAQKLGFAKWLVDQKRVGDQ